MIPEVGWTQTFTPGFTGRLTSIDLRLVQDCQTPPCSPNDTHVAIVTTEAGGSPVAVLVSFEEYRRLTPEAAPDLGALSQEFDELLARMQSVRRATRALFAASPSALAKAAVAEARDGARRRKRG